MASSREDTWDRILCHRIVSSFPHGLSMNLTGMEYTRTDSNIEHPGFLNKMKKLTSRRTSRTLQLPQKPV